MRHSQCPDVDAVCRDVIGVREHAHRILFVEPLVAVLEAEALDDVMGNLENGTACTTCRGTQGHAECVWGGGDKFARKQGHSSAGGAKGAAIVVQTGAHHACECCA